MATKKKFDIENPTDEMMENLEACKPEDDGVHITKLSKRDSRRLIEILTDELEPSEEVKARWCKAKESYDRWFIGRRP